MKNLLFPLSKIKFVIFLSISAVLVIFVLSCQKENSLLTNKLSTNILSTEDCTFSINVGKIHNDVMKKMMGNNTVSSWEAVIKGLNSSQIYSLKMKLADSTSNYLNTNYGYLTTGQDILFFNSNVDSIFNIIDPQHTYSISNSSWTQLGYTANAAQKINQILNTLTTNFDDSIACKLALNSLKNNLGTSFSCLERKILENLCDFCFATEKLWLDIPQGNSLQVRKGDKRAAAHADAIGFAFGAIHGALHGGLGGGPAGAVAGALLGGAGEALWCSAITYWWD